MIDYDKYTELLQWHAGVEQFDYNPVIDWAIEMILRGRETENMLILASFPKPVYRDEIKPYVSKVLMDLDLEEKIAGDPAIADAYYYVQQILDGHKLRINLYLLFVKCIENDYPEKLQPFYNLYFAWDDLDHLDHNYYYAGATRENIDIIVKLECQKFIAKYIYKNNEEAQRIDQQLRDIVSPKPTKTSFFSNFRWNLKKTKH